MKRTPTHDRLGYKSFYRRNLPHIQPLNTALFLTFRLAGSLPIEVLGRMADERRLLKEALKNDPAGSPSRFRELARRHFSMLESWLDKPASGPTWLGDERVAAIVAEALQYRDGRVIDWTPTPSCQTTSIRSSRLWHKEMSRRLYRQSLHSLKRNTARRANTILGRSGAFWEHESFDHYIRNRVEWKRIVRYVLENPVKAGLARGWREWPWNYVRDPLVMQDAN